MGVHLMSCHVRAGDCSAVIPRAATNSSNARRMITESWHAHQAAAAHQEARADDGVQQHCSERWWPPGSTSGDVVMLCTPSREADETV